MQSSAWRLPRPLPDAFALPASFALVAIVAVADYLTGYEVRLAILYLLPISLASWKLGRRAGALVAVTAAACWAIAFQPSNPYSSLAYFYWEALINFAMFLVVAMLLARLREALEHSDRRFVTVLEGLDEAVHVEDARTGELLYGNRRFREAFGTVRAFARAEGEVSDEAGERWYFLHSRSLRWTDGRAALLRVVTDVTEERRAREELARQRDSAHRAARLLALGEFASGVAHELNQPLTAIATYNQASLRLLASGAGHEAELREAMEKCRDQAKRAGEIIERLRELLRRPLPGRGTCDANDIAVAVRELASDEAREAGVVLEVRAAQGLPAVRAERVLAEQVGLNLVRNAIEAVRALPQTRRHVAIATEPGPGSVVLSVTDLGEGLPPSVRARLFEPFLTTKPRGLGLGLSMCRAIVASLGGEIACDPVPGGGTRFWFSLPAERA